VHAAAAVIAHDEVHEAEDDAAAVDAFRVEHAEDVVQRADVAAGRTH
jgi:hypothetical protein